MPPNKSRQRPPAEYRTLAVETGAPLTEAEQAALATLQAKYPRADFYVEPDPTHLTLHLHTMNVDAVRADLKAHLNGTASSPLYRLLAEVEAIGSYSLRGPKRLFVGFNNERKVTNRKTKEQQRGQYYYAQDHGFSKDANDLPTDYNNTILCGDSLKLLKQLPDNCVDLVLTSPPYNFGLGYNASGDEADWPRYFETLFTIFDECIRVLKFGGRIIVNVQPLFSDYIPSHHLISNFFLQRKLIWKGEILWEKNNYNCKYTAWGSYKSPSSPYLKYTWEFLEIFCKGDLKKEGQRANADISAEDFKKWVVAKWSIGPERKMKSYGHPAMFPEELARRAIQLFSFKNDVVLDPFNGAGTTTTIAHELERRFLGLDISPDYCQTARLRLEADSTEPNPKPRRKQKRKSD